MDNSHSATRHSQLIKHVEDLPLEVLFVENVQSHNVKVCKKIQINVGLNGSGEEGD